MEEKGTGVGGENRAGGVEKRRGQKTVEMKASRRREIRTTGGGKLRHTGTGLWSAGVHLCTRRCGIGSIVRRRSP